MIEILLFGSNFYSRFRHLRQAIHFYSNVRFIYADKKQDFSETVGWLLLGRYRRVWLRKRLNGVYADSFLNYLEYPALLPIP